MLNLYIPLKIWRKLKRRFLENIPLLVVRTLLCIRSVLGPSDNTLVSAQWKKATNFTRKTSKPDSKDLAWPLTSLLTEGGCGCGGLGVDISKVLYVVNRMWV